MNGGKTYAIADLHGRFDLLSAALTLIERDAGADAATLICMGDFIDRGPQSRNIIDLFMAGPSLPNWRWIILQGNHEEMMLRCLDNPHMMRWWLGNGGSQTLLSYGYREGDQIFPLKIPQEHLDWVRALPVTYEDGQRIFVHAGVPFDQWPNEAKPEIMQWMLYPGDVEHGNADFYPDEPHVSGMHIVHGHHQSAAHPLLKPHRTNLDSFAWYTGRLAIGVFNNDQAAPERILEVFGEAA
jgi:serine/threonine protein phosphatase 1